MKSVIQIFVFVAVVTVTMMAVKSLSNSHPLPILGEVPEFSLTTSEAQSFSRDDLEGSVSAISFFFSSCQGPCPAMNASIASIASEFSDDEDVVFVSISVDPKRDSPEKLAEYRKSFAKEKNEWLFLTKTDESQPSPADLSAKFLLAGGETPESHSLRLVVVDKSLKIRGFFNVMNELDATAAREAIAQLR